MLARAIVNFIRDGFKKIVSGIYYSFFATLTMPVSVSIVHSNVSPLVTFKKSLAKAGIVVVKEPATDCILVSYFIFIPHIYSILYINTYIYLFTNIYNFLYSIIYRNLYISHILNYYYRSIPGAATPGYTFKKFGREVYEKL